jgi:hypothetical protein
MGRMKPGDVVREFEEKRYVMDTQLKDLKPGEISFRANMPEFFKIIDDATKQKNDMITVVDEKGDWDLERPNLTGEPQIKFKMKKEELFKILDQRQQIRHNMIELIGDLGITRFRR